jgi:pantetheine-phosphate adenylyltransferase
MKRIAIYPGTFDPITNGHLDVIERALKLVDELHILISTNVRKSSLFTVDERLLMLKEVLKDKPNVRVESTSLLTVNYCENLREKEDAHIFLIRGIRNTTDFNFEYNLAIFNRDIILKLKQFSYHVRLNYQDYHQVMLKN